MRFYDGLYSRHDYYFLLFVAQSIKPMLARQTTILLTFVRHGETASNKVGMLQGHVSTPLNETGREQAGLAGHALKTTQFDNVHAYDLYRVI